MPFKPHAEDAPYPGPYPVTTRGIPRGARYGVCVTHNPSIERPGGFSFWYWQLFLFSER
ncbi:MAG: hypothetical protein AMXMBFR84_37220 [Candidatus Hydrogenedentota bacterium]